MVISTQPLAIKVVPLTWRPGKEILRRRHKPDNGYQWCDGLIAPQRCYSLHGRLLSCHKSATASPPYICFSYRLYLWAALVQSFERALWEKNYPPDQLRWLYGLYLWVCSGTNLVRTPCLQVPGRVRCLSPIYHCWRDLCRCIL